MPWDKNDPYYIYGLVGADEWDWRKEGKMIAKNCWKDPFAFIRVDVGKYLGLLRRLDALEKPRERKNGPTT